MFPAAAPRRNIEIRGKQNSLFPSGPVIKVTANLFGLEFCKNSKSHHKIAHYIYFVLKKKLFENVQHVQHDFPLLTNECYCFVALSLP